MTDDRQPAYDAVIPARVRYDPALPDKAKLLYGEIRALASRDGYCWASTAYFCRLYGVSDECVNGHLRALEKQGHIIRECLRDADTSQVLERRLWVDLRKYSVRDRDAPPPEKLGTPPQEILGTPPQEILEENNTSKNSTSVEDPPVVPPAGGRRPRSKKEPRKAPDWKPERFAGFWAYYPRGENKQKAMDAWDRLRPSDELIDRIGRALVRLKQTPDWQEGVGIPHASTFLNNARWEDADRLTAPAPARGWAEDPEVMTHG